MKCLATRFDGEPDSNGRIFSQNHFRDTGDTWDHGTVKRVLRNNVYKVLYDGDSRQSSSAAEHLTLATPPSPPSSGGEEDAKDETDSEGQREAAEKNQSDGDELPQGDGEFQLSDVDEDELRLCDETEDPSN